MNTLDTGRLQAFVQAAVADRKDKIYNSAKNSIQILPTFKDAIMGSNQVSGKCHLFVSPRTVEKGRAVHLLKPSTKKRKRRSELEEEKKSQESSKRKLRDYDSLAEEYQRTQQQLQEVTEAATQMQEFIHQQQQQVDKRDNLSPQADKGMPLLDNQDGGAGQMTQ